MFSKRAGLQEAGSFIMPYYLLLQRLDNGSVGGDSHGRILARILEFDLVDDPAVVVLLVDARDFGIADLSLDGLANRLWQGTQLRFRGRASFHFEGRFPARAERSRIVADNRTVGGEDHLRIGTGIGELDLVNDPVVPLCFVYAGDLRPRRVGFHGFLHGRRKFIELSRRVRDLLRAADDERSCKHC